ncbi:MAG: hypothetical protein IPJ26_14050 [Bacteroidetes bacterium]|nr:hypothetical protein [Bacteroidota bacterium]
MYRDNGFALADDHLRVYINTAPTMTGATLLSNTLGSNKLSRYKCYSSSCHANTWNQYNYNLTAATSQSSKRYYFIIMGVCKDGNNIYLGLVYNKYVSICNTCIGCKHQFVLSKYCYRWYWYIE